MAATVPVRRPATRSGASSAHRGAAGTLATASRIVRVGNPNAVVGFYPWNAPSRQRTARALPSRGWRAIGARSIPRINVGMPVARRVVTLLGTTNCTIEG
eukprot:3477198-Pyramimonas_sp.AAC.1